MKKKILTTLSVVLILGMAALGILAYLSDTDSDVNVMTLGNVKIDQIEQERNTNGELVEFTSKADSAVKKPLFPAVYPGNSTSDSIPWDDAANWAVANNEAWKTVVKNDNVVDKFVTVKNTGESAAYVRTIIAYEGDAINGTDIHIVQNAIDSSDSNVRGEFAATEYIENVDINGVRYDVIVYTYKDALAKNETTIPSLKQVYMDHTCTNDDVAKYGDTYDILVLSQAVQVEGFENARAALKAGFGEATAENVAKWFAKLEPSYIPSIKVNADTPETEIEELFAEGEDFYVEEDITIKTGSDKYMEVNGDVGIYAADDASITFEKTTVLTGKGTVTVNSGSLETPQELCVSGESTLVINDGEHSFGAFSATSNGKIVVNGGTLNCKGTYAGVMGISFAENGSLVVNGGKLNMYQPFNLNANRCDKAYIEINGGTVDLLNGIENLFVVRNIMDKDRTSGVLRGSSIRVNGGTFIAHYEIDSAGDATSFIRNGDYPADTNKVLVSNTFNSKADYDCKVTGGTFYGSWQRADNQRYVDGNGGYSDGLFVENSIAGFISDGYQINGDATNGYVVTKK